MPVDVYSDTAVDAYRAQHSNEQSIDLLEITVPVFDTYRICNNGVDVTSQNRLYLAWWFELADPNEDDSEPSTQLTMAVKGLDALAALESTADPIRARWSDVLASDPDTPMRRWRHFTAEDIVLDGVILSATLVQTEHSQWAYPPRVIDKIRFPGLFRLQT